MVVTSPSSSPDSISLPRYKRHGPARHTYSKRASTNSRTLVLEPSPSDSKSGSYNFPEFPSRKRARRTAISDSALSESSASIRSSGNDKDLERPEDSSDFTRHQDSLGQSSARGNDQRRDLSIPQSLSDIPLSGSPSISPSTPPRKRSSGHPTLTPQSSPRDLSALFAAVAPASSSAGRGKDHGSPGSGRSGLTRIGMRRMLTKTQSLGQESSPRYGTPMDDL
ncbi:hypothetical protein TREMEDRAFT_56579, partial [Tremella mesenterica DSM 1558]|uniref:uncharacterized protein n=1 Tax=Tremella mesenterica (strain ATCC 24925 / CBS 8224 / DSM 1558 / NBRC 9311 / NRRL Y-6157 / RJB 2259-6 / UBC 559-6) TaxID=578456 RepID=UPI0003F4A3A3